MLLIVNGSQFHRSKYLRAAGEVTGRIYSVTDRIYSYLHLRRANVALSERLAQVSTELYAYRNRLERGQGGLTGVDSLAIADSAVYRFIPAKVVNNGISLLENYMTLNKGSNDGICPDMGVLSASGVVGVVVNTSPHFSTAISLLNIKYKLSGKIKRNNYYGPLAWDGKETQYSYLTDISRYADFTPGDTIVTSGYSTVFPKDLPVGYVVDAQRQRDDNYISLRVRLFTNFNNLSEVLIVTNRLQAEQQELEERTATPTPKRK
jgi:rod shape-determining protein MreC